MLELPYLKEFIDVVKNTAKVDDVVDRITHFWTTTICIIFGMITASKLLLGRPMECMVPSEYVGAWADYTRQYCYITSTYTVPLGIEYQRGVTREVIENMRRQHPYYQWVPVILLLQAVSTYFPHFIWNCFLKIKNADIDYILKQARELRYLHGDERVKSLDQLVNYLKSQISYTGTRNRVSYAGFGCYLSYLHLFVKVLTVFVICGNIYFINYFFGDNETSLWGFDMVQNVFASNASNVLNETSIFPRVTFCNFSQPTNFGFVERTMQCTLMVNMLNEKIFIFLWFWFSLIFICAASNVFCNALVLFVPYFRQNKVKYFMKPSLNSMTESFSDSSSGYNKIDLKIETFARDILEADGVHLLQLIREHAGGLVASEVACTLYERLH
uniref:Innexin n=1 Tax=Panagrolaimus sp. JU765 TaxID=591449 RepID=A0AC34QAS3_9BILA